MKIFRATFEHGTVFVGSTELNGKGRHYKVEHFISHPKYGTTIFTNDIALAKVAEEILFNANVQPIELSSQDAPDLSSALLAGWGRASIDVSQRKKYFINFQIYQT